MYQVGWNEIRNAYEIYTGEYSNFLKLFLGKIIKSYKVNIKKEC